MDLAAARKEIFIHTMPHVNTNGWTWKSVMSGARTAGIHPQVAQRAFPDGISSVMDYLSVYFDTQMLDILEKHDFAKMRIRERVTISVRVRLELMSPYRDAIRRAFSLSLISTTTGSFHTDGGAGIAKKLYVGTDLDVDGTSNLDAVDIDGATQIDATVTVGVDDTGYDVKFFGATSGSYWLWDEDADGVVQVGSTQLTGTVTVGVDDTGHDVKFFGASAGAFMLYDQSEDTLEIRGPSADATTSTGKLLLSTALTDINDGDVLGRIDFQAPLEAGGTDAIVVGATILAEADATFSSSVNSTDLVFATGDSGAATEKFRIDSTGVCTFADGAIDVDIASHDGTNGLKLGGTLVTATAATINGAASNGKSIAMAFIFGA